VDVPIHKIDWNALVPPEQWAVYKSVLDAALGAGVPFALGGGLAVGLYTGRPRNTKDLDIYVRPEDRDRMVEIVTACGLSDYFDEAPYDRQWIYRGHRDEVIVDTIWSMANQRASVDDRWLNRGPVIRMFDRQFPAIPVEELIWSKLYVLQRDRCDWPDILNLICAAGRHLDWAHLLDRVAEDRPLLKGVLAIFSWVSPHDAEEIPERVWYSLELPRPTTARDPEGRPARPDLLDTRPWFFEQLTRRELQTA
jgi:hypothetical protein